ncbi:hypothetical protein [Acidaminococcus fermentans]|uniref:hypothetical protein n=1 Tax=Acidaminococcus fermentans TaxID=905 RepID=UPI003D056AB5
MSTVNGQKRPAKLAPNNEKRSGGTTFLQFQGQFAKIDLQRLLTADQKALPGTRKEAPK